MRLFGRLFFSAFLIVLSVPLACNGRETARQWVDRASSPEAGDEKKASVAAKAESAAPPAAEPVSHPVALPDKGIWSDLDHSVFLRSPEKVDPKRTAVVVDKQRRILTLTVDGVPIAAYPVALGFEPAGHKQIRGDGRTPEGRYHICERLHRRLAARYGARSMRLSYPNARDAVAGLAAGQISAVQKKAIEAAEAARDMPPQNTPLGGSIRIHGGGVGRDWTLGCIALRDPDVIDLYAATAAGTQVRVLGPKDKLPFGDRDGDGIADQIDLLLGAKKTAANNASYDGRYIKILAQGGDVPRSIGVCTDVVVRALRNAGLDLQLEIQRDRARAPGAYPRIKEPDPSIDHRRVKNFIPWFKRHWKSLPIDDFATFLPGDVILMDTLYYPGPDHCGIISDASGPSGRPLVINNWTYGYRTSEMDLLDVIPVLEHYRWVD